MKKSGAKLEMDDAFTPKQLTFNECGTEIVFWIDDEAIRVNFESKDGHKHSIRMPLYAAIALGQMVTRTLNGQKFLK